MPHAYSYWTQRADHVIVLLTTTGRDTRVLVNCHQSSYRQQRTCSCVHKGRADLDRVCDDKSLRIFVREFLTRSPATSSIPR